MDFGIYQLIAQEVVAEDEAIISKLFQDNFSWFTDSVDKEYLGKSAIVAACMRRRVVAIEVTELCEVVINFEGGLKLFIPTDVSVVDWQWCLSETGKDPYQDFIIACFEQGKINVNDV